jgi:glutamine synthetase
MNEMTTLKLEYVWIGSNGFHGETWTLRSKLKVHRFTADDIAKLALGDISSVPLWSFDGSSTGQATGDNSDCILAPIRAVTDTVRDDGMSIIVLCEVLNPDGTPHTTNNRTTLIENEIANKELGASFGLEQEYSIMKNGRPLGFPVGGYPPPQGPYYCSAGADRCFGREISEEHVDACIKAGINITGTNVEVKPGQHEYQVGGPSVGPTLVSDELWISRWMLLKIAEKHGLGVTFEAKPVAGEWNGAGLHHNVSTKELREDGSEEKFKAIMDRMSLSHKDDMKVYGVDNHLRMTGELETSSLDEFSWGVSDRGCSVRIPVQTIQNNWCGYFEDRRPASSIDPYQTTNAILRSLIEPSK